MSDPQVVENGVSGEEPLIVGTMWSKKWLQTHCSLYEPAAAGVLQPLRAHGKHPIFQLLPFLQMALLGLNRHLEPA